MFIYYVESNFLIVLIKKVISKLFHRQKVKQVEINILFTQRKLRLHSTWNLRALAVHIILRLF